MPEGNCSGAIVYGVRSSRLGDASGAYKGSAFFVYVVKLRHPREVPHHCSCRGLPFAWLRSIWRRSSNEQGAPWSQAQAAARGSRSFACSVVARAYPLDSNRPHLPDQGAVIRFDLSNAGYGARCRSPRAASSWSSAIERPERRPGRLFWSASPPSQHRRPDRRLPRFSALRRSELRREPQGRRIKAGSFKQNGRRPLPPEFCDKICLKAR